MNPVSYLSSRTLIMQINHNPYVYPLIPPRLVCPVIRVSRNNSYLRFGGLVFPAEY